MRGSVRGTVMACVRDSARGRAQSMGERWSIGKSAGVIQNEGDGQGEGWGWG